MRAKRRAFALIFLVAFATTTLVAGEIRSRAEGWRPKQLTAIIWRFVDAEKDVQPRAELYDMVQIRDPAEKSAGIYARISQRGVDYLAALFNEGKSLKRRASRKSTQHKILIFRSSAHFSSNDAADNLRVGLYDS